MKYIRELVKKLSEQEFQQLKAAHFSTTEEALISFYKTEKEEKTNLEISAILKIKESTLKKLQSVLLNKIIVNLATDDIFKQIDFLSNANCHKILIHLSKKKLNQFIKEGKHEETKKLLITISYSLLSAIVTDYNIKELQSWEALYLKVGSKNEDGYKKLRVLNLILEMYQFDNWQAKRLKSFKKQIDAIQVSKKNIELNFWHNKLLGDFYNITDEAKYIEMVKVNYDLLEQNNIVLPFKLEVNNKLQYCFYLIYNNLFEETYNYFKSLEKTYPKVVGSNRGLRYIDLISQVCITLGKHEEAKAYILNAYPIEKEKPGKFSEIYFGNTTVLAMLNILENNLELAYQRIQAAKIGLKKQYFIFLDGLLRITEQAYYLKIEDYDYADTLYQKNLKFYQYHKNSDIIILENGHKLLNAYAKLKFENKAVSSKLMKYQEALNQREFAFLGHFIQQLKPNLSR